MSESMSISPIVAMDVSRPSTPADVAMEDAPPSSTSISPIAVTRPHHLAHTRSSIYLAAYIHGHPARALVDSGSMLNIVSSDFVQKHGLDAVRLAGGDMKASGVSGVPFRITHSVTATLMMKLTGGRIAAMKVLFFVTPQNNDIILGMPWLSECGIIINFADNSVRFGSPRVIAAATAAAIQAYRRMSSTLSSHKRSSHVKDPTRKTRSSLGDSLALHMARLDLAKQQRR